MEKSYHVYIMSNLNNTVIYTGVTSDLKCRVWQHKNKIYSGFSKKYNTTKLIYFGEFDQIMDAIAAERKIKSWSRVKKNNLIKTQNPTWIDLSFEWFNNKN